MGELWHLDGTERAQRNVLLRARDTYDYSFIDSFIDWLYAPTALTPGRRRGLMRRATQKRTGYPVRCRGLDCRTEGAVVYQEPALARRADAERNRVKILAVAHEAFGEPGDEPSMAEIARRAGVGMATLYRNFPGRFDLISALYRNQVDEICAAAKEMEGETPGAVFFAWLERFHTAGARKGPLASLLLADSGGGSSVVNESRSRVIAAGEPLFAAAQRSGEVRDDLPLKQVLDAVVAVGQIEDDPAFPGRIVRVVLDGLRRRPA